MRRSLTPLVLAFLLLPLPGWAGSFSLYGGRMGMPREELDKVWTRVKGEEYQIKDSPVFNIRPEFDHRDRLFRLSFSLPLTEQWPPALVATAFQNLVTDAWGGDGTVSLSVRTGKGFGEVTVTSKTGMEEYLQHIKLQMAPLLKP